ncbi:MAG: hypothetical protein ACFWT0_00630 [Bifidobacterium crudilactis]
MPDNHARQSMSNNAKLLHKDSLRGRFHRKKLSL